MMAHPGARPSERPYMVEEARRIPVFGEFDVVVLGGGPAGIAAATAAGRCGCSVVLAERYGFLGGMGTAAGVTTFAGLHANVYGEHRQVVHGVVDDLLARMERLGGLNAPHLSLGGRIMAQAYDTAAYKVAADDLVLSAGVKLLFHTLGVGALMTHEREIAALLVETKSGRFAIRGRVFIDCSGDADLAAWAGVPYEKGDGRGKLLYPTTMFRINGVDPERAGRAWELLPQIMEEAEREGRRFPRRAPILRPQRNPLEWRANVTQIRLPDGRAVDGTDVEQLTYGEVEGRRQVWAFFEFLRERLPGFENAYIVDIAPQLGIRETRRIVGEYQLTEEDVVGCASFEDTIGVNGWPVEEHVQGDVVIRWPPIPDCRGFHHLPYRILLPQKVDNLLVAGRCASMTHGGQSSARVSGPCFVMGQAAGTAAALALQLGIPVRHLPVARLQALLERDGVYLGRDL
ncbi:MAG: FAD-dependent oxidoreductase [Armatimonadetes bacterium]|nr:FAD-dependent oxidoreductase [Armatimonadota bacterium]MDW8153122.1 FAD-dependent oxidoreductase [Armatimonadota bacterium]